jgi:acyl-CoA reductase-like NAD-dependent aldehyde dehydrogenase
MARAVATDLPQVQPLVNGGRRDSADREVLHGVTGMPLAVVHYAPPLLARRMIGSMSLTAAADSSPQRPAVVARGGQLFSTATLAGETPEEYCRRHALATGVPISMSADVLAELPAWTAALAQLVQHERAAVPVDTDGLHGKIHRIPRGRTLGVVAPSNHPATLTAWLHAYALGYCVAVRPGQRDPFTPARAVQALLAAGADPATLMLLPGPHSTARAVIDATDLALVYGDQQTVEAYTARADVAVRGPGRTKVLLTTSPDQAALNYLAEAVTADAGVRCTNISVIYTAGDHEALAETLAARLATLPALSPEDPQAVLPVRSQADADWLHQAVIALKATNHSARHGELLTPLPEGGAVIHPTVLSVATANHPAISLELPFPFAVVAPWRRQDGIAPLRNSLVAVLLDDDTLVQAALAEPTIRKVIRGPVLPWRSRPGVPHDGDLSCFLLESKAELTSRRPAWQHGPRS